MTNHLFKITTKRSRGTGNERIAKDMEVEIVTNLNYPLSSQEGKQKIADAFKNKYGIDMQKANALNTVDLNIEKKS
ncbi:MAG: hypothetical protein IKO56_10770 [Alphaproteobacteria bacterium]|nr:hypothetical protein [Alphaproteobacteria bacterium]